MLHTALSCVQCSRTLRLPRGRNKTTERAIFSGFQDVTLLRRPKVLVVLSM